MDGKGRKYKQTIIRTAKELQYPATVIERLKKAKSDSEISRIMISAREGSC